MLKTNSVAVVVAAVVAFVVGADCRGLTSRRSTQRNGVRKEFPSNTLKFVTG